jgi:hypothetical protein
VVVVCGTGEGIGSDGAMVVGRYDPGVTLGTSRSALEIDILII